MLFYLFVGHAVFWTAELLLVEQVVAGEEETVHAAAFL